MLWVFGCVHKIAYNEGVYEGHEPFKVVGIRENQVELEGDFSGGTHNVCQKDWFDDDKVFVVKTVCEEQLKPNGCQVHNVHCCGGGSVINKHVSYWDGLVSWRLRQGFVSVWAFEKLMLNNLKMLIWVQKMRA